MPGVPRTSAGKQGGEILAWMASLCGLHVPLSVMLRRLNKMRPGMRPYLRSLFSSSALPGDSFRAKRSPRLAWVGAARPKAGGLDVSAGAWIRLPSRTQGWDDLGCPVNKGSALIE